MTGPSVQRGGCRRVAWVGLIVLVSIGAAGCSKTVPIGVILSESGAAAPYGEKVRKGLDLARDEINASRGFGGARVRLIYKDDATNPEVAREMTRELIEKDGVRIIIGSVSSPVTLRIAPLCEKSRVVLLSPTCSAPAITRAGEYIFRNYPSDVFEGTSMADFARDLGLRRMAVFAVDNEFGAGLSEVFDERFRGDAREVVRTFHFREGDTAAFGSMIRDLAPLRPDGIFVVGYVADLAALVRKIREAGIDAVLVGTSSVTEEFLRLAGGAAENLVYPATSFDPRSDDLAVRVFVEAYRARYREEPDTFAAHGYDALRLVDLAMEHGAATDAESVRKGLLGIHNYQGPSGLTAFDENGDVVQYPRLFIVRRGKAIPYDRFVEEGGMLRIPGRD